MKKIASIIFLSIFILVLNACSIYNEPKDDSNVDTVLENARIEAYSIIDGYKNPSLYREAEKLLLNEAVLAGKLDVKNAKTLEEIENAVTNALRAIDEIKTDNDYLLLEGENSGELLLKAQDDAVILISNYLDEADYFEEEIKQINKIINEGILNIRSASDIPSIDVIVNSVKILLDKVKTKTDYANELGDSLEEAKKNAIEILENYASVDDYRSSEAYLVKSCIIFHVSYITNSNSIEEVNQHLNNAKGYINSLKTKAEYEQEEALKAFENAKESAIDDLENHVFLINYYEEQIIVIQNIISVYSEYIANAISISEVNAFLNSGRSMLESVLTKQQIDQQEETSLPEVNNYGDFLVFEVSGHLESMYMTFKGNNAVLRYNAYYRSSGSDWQSVDEMLIREYASYYRVDVIGLKAGTYDLKVASVKNGVDDNNNYTIVKNIKVLSHVREGFAFVNGTSSGAYNEDGTLKVNARVVYVTPENKDKITLSIPGTSKTYNGLFDILSNYSHGPLAVRIIGTITVFNKTSSGDMLIQTKNDGAGITLEGVGNDAVAYGWGVIIKKSTNVEVRNIGFMLTSSNEGDSVGLNSDNDHIWIHNNDFFYGMPGADEDQFKGDGALDTKKSKYVTHSYNHFWDTGKTHLVGNGESTSEQNYLTFHHNWYDHSDSRHPRIRKATVHIYNNLFDGISKYGVGATTGSSVFVEANIFKNTKKPMLISLQGSDDGTFSGEDGGMIKAYNNLSIGSTSKIIYSKDNSSFDAYLAQTRNEKVPSSVKTVSGNNTYNNFDTASNMYIYQPTDVNKLEVLVKKYAGRVNGGDFKFTFTDADNTKYDINEQLFYNLVQYKTGVLSVAGVKV